MNLGAQKPLVTGICIAAIVISILSLFLTQCERSPKIDVSRQAAATEGLGKRLGQELPEGSKLVLVMMDSSVDSPVFRGQTQGFNRGFGPYEGKFKIVGRVTVKIDDMSRGTGAGMPNKVYLDILKQYPDADAVASLIGIPLLTDQEIDQLPANVPRLYAVILYGVGVKRAFEEGILSAAILPKIERINPEGDPQDADALFDKYYRYITEQNYESLAS